ncbi:DNA gyrase subunit A [Anoxybacter fermentans]|nr:DNA gyrase subunit A [Anoxybacter fermentans]
MEGIQNDHVKLVGIEDQMKNAYLDYAMSVIVGRALPDVRDGLKPVHRRILYAMYELGMYPNKPYKKSARIVGEVLGKYHPHGDSAVYDTMVRMAQDFSYRYPLIDGHGNFGSIDGDAAAAMRYTEARMSQITMELLSDIDKNTVDFRPNFDDSLKEPEVLPARLPNLLINGASGIAVGMATNIPPHNLGEVIDGIIMLIDNPEVSIEKLMKVIKGPDFPTGGIIMGRNRIKKAYKTGRGHLKVRARTNIEEMKNGKHRIVVTEIPYQVNKAKLIEKIAELVREGKIKGITDLRDESDREGLRIVIELRKDVVPKIVLNQLFKHTRLQVTFGVINLVLVNNEPKVLNLKELLQEYISHQKEVVTRRIKYDLKKAEDKAHILEGLRIALADIDRVIQLIRSSKDTAIAKERLIDTFKMTERQAQAILDMRLQRLTGLEREKIEIEYKELLEKIAFYKDVLNDEKKLYGIIKEELLELKEKYADERRTEIVQDYSSLDAEDLIPQKDSVITLTHQGYIKRMPLDLYRSQRRGGRGITGMSTKEEDFVECMITATTHDYFLFFTNKGLVYRLKGYQIPEASRQSRGTAIVNLLELQPDERVTAVIPVRNFSENKYLVTITKNGLIKKTPLVDYESKYTSLIGVTLREGDELISVRLAEEGQDIIVGTAHGKAIRFSEREVRSMGRSAQGVKAITLDPQDYVVGMGVISEGSRILTVTNKGYGKLTLESEYRPQTRGGKGLITIRLTEKNGHLITLRVVNKEKEIMMISSGGIMIRIPIEEISVLGRNTLGVKMMRLDPEDEVVSVALIDPEDEKEIEEPEKNDTDIDEIDDLDNDKVDYPDFIDQEYDEDIGDD